MQQVFALILGFIVIHGQCGTVATENLSCRAISISGTTLSPSPEAICLTLGSSDVCVEQGKVSSECHSESNACPDLENIYRPTLRTFPVEDSYVGSCPPTNANKNCIEGTTNSDYGKPQHLTLETSTVDTQYYNVTVTWIYGDNGLPPQGTVFGLTLESPETLVVYCVCINITAYNMTSYSVVVKYNDLHLRNYLEATLSTFPRSATVKPEKYSTYHQVSYTISNPPSNCADTNHGITYDNTSCALPFYGRPRNVKVVTNKTATRISWDPPCYRDSDACRMIDNYPGALRPSPDTYYLTVLLNNLTYHFVIHHATEVILSSVEVTDFKLYTQTPCSGSCEDTGFLNGCSQPAILDGNDTDTCCGSDLTSVPFSTAIPTVTPPLVVTIQANHGPLIGSLAAVFVLALGLLTTIVIIAIICRGKSPQGIPEVPIETKIALVVFSPRTNKEETFTILQSLCADLSLFNVKVSAYGNDDLRLSPTEWVVARRSEANAVLCVCNQEFYEDWTETAPYVNDAPRIVQTLKQLFEGDLHLGSEVVGHYAVIKMKTTDSAFVPPLLVSRPSYMYYQTKEIAHFAHNKPIARL